MADELPDTGIPSPDGTSAVIITDYEMGQDNVEGDVLGLPFDIHNPVFLISGLSIVAFVFFTLALPQQASDVFSAMFSFTTTNFDWFLIGAANIVVLFALMLIVTPFGSVRLGGEDATPDYTYMGWFAMLFAAGMGIGLMFYGVSEPLTHFSTAFGDTAVGEDGLRTDWAPLGGATGDEPGCHDLSLGAAPLGNLCNCGTCTGLVLVQQGLAADDPVGLSSTLGGPDLGMARPRHRHHRRFCNAVRTGNLVGFWCHAGKCRFERAVWRTNR